MSTRHTLEPWFVTDYHAYGSVIKAGIGITVTDCNGDHGSATDAANAARIVACVNLLAPHPDLAGVEVVSGEALSTYDQELNQRLPIWSNAVSSAEIIGYVITTLEAFHDVTPCQRDHHGGCQAHGYIGLGKNERCPQQEIPERIEWLRAHQKWLTLVSQSLKPSEALGLLGRGR